MSVAVAPCERNGKIVTAQVEAGIFEVKTIQLNNYFSFV